MSQGLKIELDSISDSSFTVSHDMGQTTNDSELISFSNGDEFAVKIL